MTYQDIKKDLNQLSDNALLRLNFRLWGRTTQKEQDDSLENWTWDAEENEWELRMQLLKEVWTFCDLSGNTELVAKLIISELAA